MARVPRIKRILRFGFLLMGFSFTVTQGLLIRELLVAFFGNELSIGLILGNWLVLEAVGSGLLGKLADRWRGKVSPFALCPWAKGPRVLGPKPFVLGPAKCTLVLPLVDSNKVVP